MKPFFILKINYFTYSILDGESRHYQMVVKEEKEDKFEFQARAQAICDSLNISAQYDIDNKQGMI